MKVREYDVRTLDVHGDAIDVAHYATLAEAQAAAGRLGMDDAVAVVVEVHETVYPRRGDADKYSVVWYDGSADALRAGGWIE